MSAVQITLDAALEDLPVSRNDAEMAAFLRNAPEGWIFTRSQNHALSLRLRGLLLRPDGLADQLKDVAATFGQTPRTLIRRLALEETSFQAIKDGLRRDLAAVGLTLAAYVSLYLLLIVGIVLGGRYRDRWQAAWANPVTLPATLRISPPSE